MLYINQSTKQIICTDFCEGKKHDFKLFKDNKTPFLETQSILVDSGYTGILNILPNALIPKKKSKKHPLTTKDKEDNRDILKTRIVVENVIGDIKKIQNYIR
jgi:hypothetical protein